MKISTINLNLLTQLNITNKSLSENPSRKKKRKKKMREKFLKKHDYFGIVWIEISFGVLSC